MWSTADKFRYKSPGSIPLPVIAEVDTLVVLLQTWADFFSAFINDPSTKMTYREKCGTKVLLIQQSVAYIKTFTRLYADDSIFDKLDAELKYYLMENSCWIMICVQTCTDYHYP